jgi:3-oxoacyl-[acyl-carrier protein] reductase
MSKFANAERSILETNMNASQQPAALVTGAATGIGRAAAIALARSGFAVAVNYSRSETEARETLSAIEIAGGRGMLCKANVAEDPLVRAMVEAVCNQFGGLDVLVNNAGTTHFINHADLDAVTDDVWEEILGVNLKGTFYACRAAMPVLRARRGNIVNVTSVAGIGGQGSSIPYAASKAALNCLTKSLARAFAPEVRVNAVAPGPVLTRWLEPHPQMIERAVAMTPLRRAATPEDIGDVVVFLARGTSLMTGQVVVVDGGLSM